MTKIVTFSSLIQRSKWLFSHDYQAYERMCRSGTAQLLGKARVRFLRGESKFRIYGENLCGPDDSVGYFDVCGNYRDKKWVSRYDIDVTRTRFPRFVVETYSPFRFKDGLPAAYGGRCTRNCNVDILNLDGTVGLKAYWSTNRRRGRAGELQAGVAIDDETGLVTLADRTWTFRPGWEGDLGWFPYSSSTVASWLESFAILPGVNVTLMRELAMRCLRTAASLAKKYPMFKVRVFPATKDLKVARWDTMVNNITLDKSQYQLPEVVMYWLDERAPHTNFATYGWINWRVPPHGRPDLDPTGRVSPATNVGYLEDREPYHFLRAKAPGVRTKDWLNRACNDESCITGSVPSLAKTEAMYVRWDQHPELVQVMRKGTCQTHKFLGENVQYAMAPEDVELFVEEKLLMSSLPTC